MAIFPKVNINPVNIETSTDMKVLGRCFLFDYNENKYILENGKLVECTVSEAINQWIKLILQSYKNEYKIYQDTDFFCNIKDLIGQKPNAFVISELKREIKEAILKHRYIDSLNSIDIQVTKNKLICKFNVTLVDTNNLQSEVSV